MSDSIDEKVKAYQAAIQEQMKEASQNLRGRNLENPSSGGPRDEAVPFKPEKPRQVNLEKMVQVKESPASPSAQQSPDQSR